MNYLLFVKFNNGLMHNAAHKNVRDVLQSVKQFIYEEEESDLDGKKLLNVRELKEHLNRYDDYFGQLLNGTWFHIQPQNVFEIIK